MTDITSKKIVVTGGAGFLGANVVKELLKAGCREPYVPKIGDWDLRKKSDVERLYESERPDIVIHLAAVVGGIGFNRKYPATLLYDNLVMGLELMEGARRHGVEKFVAIGTICAYPKFAKVPFREEEIWDGYPEETNAPYGLAKKMLLVYSQALRNQYGFNSIYLLPVNLYGPNDNFDPESSHVIPAMIRKFCEAALNKEKKVVLWGDGSPTREFLYVEDCAEAIVLAACKYETPDPVNIGSSGEVRIADLANMIARMTGFKGEMEWDKEKPNGQPRRMLDTARAQKEFGFKARTTLEEGLDKTIRWYRETKKRS